MENLSSFQSLQEQYEMTKKELGEAEKTLKRISGRDPSQPAAGGSPGFLRRTFNPGVPPARPFTPRKRPLFPIIKFKDGEREERRQEEHSPVKRPSLQSTVIVTSRDVKSKKETINEQNVNSKVKDRNRRMFGNLLGTLRKFQSEETERKEQVQKKADIEHRLEVEAEEEKERVKKEKFELFNTKKEKQVQLRCLEKKMEIAELHEAWVKNARNTIGFIGTQATPVVFYLPVKLTADDKKKLEETTAKTLELIEEKKAKLRKDLSEVEEWYNKEGSPAGKENYGPENPTETLKVPDEDKLASDAVEETEPTNQIEEAEPTCSESIPTDATDQIVNTPENIATNNNVAEEEFQGDMEDDMELIYD